MRRRLKLQFVLRLQLLAMFGNDHLEETIGSSVLVKETLPEIVATLSAELE